MTTVLLKSIYVFLFFRKGLKLPLFVRKMDWGRQQRSLYFPITSSLDHSAVLYSRPHLALLLLLGRGAFTDCNLALILAFTASNWLNCHGQLHILFYNAHKLSIRSRDLLPLIYTARSRVNMWQFESSFEDHTQF